ncbi:MAG: hypothetical protein GX939_04200 [Clostridiaceae bacterium]|jgi:hypothetical protein|nr:hypothetical protein [Clostridiaceae bacterium]
MAQQENFETKRCRFEEKIGLHEDITKEDYINALESANRDRALYAWFLYKKLKELYPEVDAQKVFTEAIYEYGVTRAGAEKNLKTASEVLLDQTSKAGMLVFDQTITELGEESAEKTMKNCPLVNALRAVGAEDAEIENFCKHIFFAGDDGQMTAYPGYKISFPETLSDGDTCRMCIDRI